MRRSYVEAAFRHPLVVFGPFLLVLVLAVLGALGKPRDYISTAAIWTDTPVSAESSVGTTGGTAPPSGGQQALMLQLLTSRHFVTQVAARAQLSGFEASRPAKQVAQSIALLVADVTTTTPGPNVLSVQVTRPDPRQAERVTQAVVQEFLETERATLGRRSKAQLAYATAKVAAASRALAVAQTAVDAYQATHGNVNDSQTASLATAVTRAQEEYSTAEQDVGRYQTDLSLLGDPSVLFVLDDPSPAIPKSRLKVLVQGGAGGLLAGLTLLFAALVTFVKRDRSARVEADLEQLLGVTVSGVIPRTGDVSRLVATPYAGRTRRSRA